MARGVLVEQRVVEDGLERPDPSFAVDERELAQPRAAVVLGEERSQRLGARIGVRLDLNRAATLEADGQSLDDAALRVQRLRRVDDPARDPGT